MKAAAVGAAIAVLFASISSPSAQTAAVATNQVRIAYVPPQNPAHQALYEQLQQYGALEKLQQLLSPVRLPKSLTIKLEGCEGDANAWYEDDAVVVCYEYIDEAWQNAPKQTTRDGLAPVDGVIGPLFDVFLHETAHALFDLLKIPVFGREEDAADQVSAYLMLQFGQAESRRLILGTAYAYKTEFETWLAPAIAVGLALLLLVTGTLTRPLRWWMIASGAAVAISAVLYFTVTSVYVSRKQYSDEHGTPAQRFYNLLCIAYGADAKLFDDLQKRYLPKDRAEGCEDEYKQVAYAFETLIGPHVDRELARTVMERSWLPDVNTRLMRRPRSSTWKWF